MALDQAPMFEPLQSARLAEEVARVGAQIRRVNANRPGHIDNAGGCRIYRHMYRKEFAWREVARDMRAGAWSELPSST